LGAPFRGTEAVAAGLLTRARLYGPRYRRVYPDVYLPADRPLDLATRSRAAFLLVRDRGGVLAGYSAAALHGADCAPGDAPAEVLLASGTALHSNGSTVSKVNVRLRGATIVATARSDAVRFFVARNWRKRSTSEYARRLMTIFTEACVP